MLSYLVHFLGETHNYPARRRITGQPTAVWALTGMRMQCNGERLSSQHAAGFLHVKSPTEPEVHRQEDKVLHQNAEKLLLTLCKTLKSS